MDSSIFFQEITKGSKFVGVDKESRRFETTLRRYLKAWETGVQKKVDSQFKKALSYKKLFKKAREGDVAGIANFKIGNVASNLSSIAIAAGNKGVQRAYSDMKMLLSWDIEMTPIADFYMQHYKQFSNNLTEDIQRRIKVEVARAIESGSTTEALHQSISEIFQTPFTVKVAEKVNEAGETIRRGYEYHVNKDAYTTMVARTETQRALNNGRVYGYQQSNIAKTLKWVTNPGACEFCEPHSGEIYSVEEAQDVLPAHPNCRCTWVVEEYATFEEETESADMFDSEKIYADPNGLGMMELMKLNDSQCDDVMRVLDKQGPASAMKLLRELGGNK